MCEYCKESKSLFYNRYSKDVREVYIEQDSSITIASNNFDEEDYEKSLKIGFSNSEASKMAQYSYNIKINYCPMCGKKIIE